MMLFCPPFRVIFGYFGVVTCAVPWFSYIEMQYLCGFVDFVNLRAPSILLAF